MKYRPVILMIPYDTEFITVSSVVGNELIVDEYGEKDIKKCFLEPEVEYERKLD